MTSRYSASFFLGGDDAGEEVIHAQDQRSVAAQMGCADEQRPDRGELRPKPLGGERVSAVTSEMARQKFAKLRDVVRAGSM